MGRWADIFILLLSKDVDSNEVNLSVPMLASLGGRHVNDLAGISFQHDIAVLPQGGALHGEGFGGPRASGGEFMIIHDGFRLRYVTLYVLLTPNKRESHFACVELM